MTFALVISATLADHTIGDGRSTWFTGILLLVLYLIPARGVFHAPA